MTPVLTVTSSGSDCPAYGWRSREALLYPLRIESVPRTDGICLFLPPREADYGVSFSIFRTGAWSRYVLRSGWERLLKLRITVTSCFRRLVRKVRRMVFAAVPAACPAARARENHVVLRL